MHFMVWILIRYLLIFFVHKVKDNRAKNITQEKHWTARLKKLSEKTIKYWRLILKEATINIIVMYKKIMVHSIQRSGKILQKCDIIYPLSVILIVTIINAMYKPHNFLLRIQLLAMMESYP